MLVQVVGELPLLEHYVVMVQGHNLVIINILYLQLMDKTLQLLLLQQLVAARAAVHILVIHLIKGMVLMEVAEEELQDIVMETLVETALELWVKVIQEEVQVVNIILVVVVVPALLVLDQPIRLMEVQEFNSHLLVLGILAVAVAVPDIVLMVEMAE